MSSGSGGQDDPLTMTPTSSRNPQGSTRPLGLSLTPHQHHQLRSPDITVRASGTPSPMRLFRPANSTMMVRAPGDVNQQQHRLIPLPSGTRIFRPATSTTTQTPMRTPILRTSILSSSVSTAMPRNLTPRPRIITTNNTTIALSSAVGTLSTIRVGGGANIRLAAAGASNRDTSFTAPPPPTRMGDSSENETEDGMEPPPKKGRIARSAVHEEFNEVIVFHRRLKKNVNGRKCKHCDSEFSGKNKTNLEDHLRVFHKEEYQKALAIDNAARIAKAESLKSACEKTSILSVLFPSEGFETTELSKRKRKDDASWTSKDQEIADLLLALTIASSNLPMTFVHNSIFKIYVNHLNHKAKVASLLKTKDSIGKIWDILKERMQQDLGEASRIAITCDIWTSKLMNNSYLGVTSHFWNSRLGRRQSLKIACRQFDGFHGGTEIGKKLAEIMREYGILGRVWLLISDSAQNMIKGAREFDQLQILRREVSREAQEEDPSDDEWEGESGGVDIEEEEAEAEREIDELEQELSRIQKLVNESLHHSERLPCVAHKEWLQFLVELVEKTRDPEEPLFRLLMPQLMRYCSEFPKNELIARKLSFHCARKITTLVLETEAYAANSDPSNPENKDKVLMLPGTTEPLPPTFAGLLELQRDRDYCRVIIMTLSAVIMQVCTDCPTAMVWHYWSDNRSPSSLLGSPMDVLPDVRPYALCTPTRADTQEVRQKVKAMVVHADDRSRALYEHWSNIGADSSTSTKYATVGKILTVLEELDRFSFDSSTKDSCMDVLHKKVWGDVSSHVSGHVSPEDEAVVVILCQWAVTNKRSGEHRAFIAAKLLEQRQADIVSHDSAEADKEDEENFYSGPPIFQQLLFKFLDNEAPYFTTPPHQTSKKTKNEVANLILLFHELMSHEVFSHDAYLCTLISRGDLNTPLQRAAASSVSEFGDAASEAAGGHPDGPGGQAGFPQSPGEVWRYSRHWQYTYHFPIPCNAEDTNNHDVNQRQVILYGSGRGKDETTKQVRKLTKEILKLFSKRFSIDVAEGGKIKKHHKSEFIFSEVVTKFQELSYFDQHSVTSQCGHTVTEMVASFHTSSSSIHLPVTDHVSFLFDLAGQALNIQSLLDWCIALLKELPLVESQLIERSSVLTRVYTTNLALYIVGVLKKYHAVLILSDTDVRCVWDSLVKISYRVPVPQESPRHESSGARRPLPNLDCNSAEWCIMGYLYDLVTSCPMLRSINETAKEKYQGLKRLFAYNYYPELPMQNLTSYCINEQFVDMFKVYIKDPKNRKVDPLVVRYLHERQENQYSLVVSVLVSVINDQLDTETLNNLAILCCELTAQCSSLAQEWLGALFSLCCPSPNDAFEDLLSRVNIMEPIHDRLGVFVSILIARQCFSLQAFVVKVVARSLLQAWNENRGSPGHEAEAGARLSIHLLRRLFGTVESFQPCFYTIASPRAYPSNPLAIKLSCDRHLLASTHANVSSGIILGAIVAVLKALLVLGHSAPKSSMDVASAPSLSEDDLAKLPLGDLALWSLHQICSQEWVRDRCLQVPDDLFSKHILLDPELKPHQAQSLLRMICHMQLPPNMRKTKDTSLTIAHVLEELDEWSLRAFMVDIKLVYYRLEERKGEWVEEVSRCIVDSFQLGEKSDSKEEDSDEPRAKKAKLDKERKMKKKYGPIWMVPHLVKHLKFLQPKILKVAAYELEKHNWSRNSKTRISAGHQPFLQLILMCLKEGEYSDKEKSITREEREQEKEHLLQSLYNQLSMFLCFTNEEKSYNYEDPTARKTMLDALKLRFSLIGGLFESIINAQNSIGDWSTLLVQLIVRGVVDLTNNAELFCMVIDMLSLLIHSTLLRDKESGSGDRDEDNRGKYHTLVKKLKKEIGDKHNESIRHLRQLLPLPKCFEEVMVTEQYGLIPDAKGNKVKGFNCDKKQGLQVAEKQKVSPWDILEGHKNPAPLSWNWFQAIKTERKPLKYEEAFQNMKYMKNTLLKPASYYLEDPPLPQEDLEPTKDSKEDEKNNKNKEDMELQMNGKRGTKRGQSRIMSPGPMASGGPNTMYRGQMGGPGPGGVYGGQQPPNMGFMGGNNMQQGMAGGGGPAMGQQMGYNQPGMGYSGGGGGHMAPSMQQGGNMAPNMQQGGGGGYSGGGPGMMAGPGTNTKVAIQQMLSSRRMPGPGGGQFVGGPGPGGGAMGPGPSGMMRPSGQYGGNMMGPGGQNMNMSRPMYPGPGGQGMANMGSNYGMQGQGGYGGFSGNNPNMRMNTPGPGQPMGGMRSGPGQYGMGGMNQNMGMSNMPMSRGNMMSSGPGYGMGSQGRQSGYGMQGGMGPNMGSNMGGPGPGPGMMSGMRPMGPGPGPGPAMMSGGMQGMQGQGMNMNMQNSGMAPGMMSGMQGGMQPGGSQLMAHLQRGTNMGPASGPGSQGMGYQQNRF